MWKKSLFAKTFFQMLKSLDPGPYLGQITSGKWVGAQNEKLPNRDMQNYFEISK